MKTKTHWIYLFLLYNLVLINKFGFSTITLLVAAHTLSPSLFIVNCSVMLIKIQ